MARISGTVLPGFLTGRTHFLILEDKAEKEDRIPFKPNVGALLVERLIDIRLDQAVKAYNILE
jgi:hypothetical protein